MSTILDFKTKCMRLGICERYQKEWAEARGPRDLIKMATSVQGAEFMCDGTAWGWGLSPDYILQNFAPYINGGEVMEQAGYDSEMYVRYTEDIVVRSTLVVLLDCHCKVIVPSDIVCTIYTALGKVTITGNGKPVVEKYGDNEVTIECAWNRLEYHTKSDWKTNDSV